VLVVCEAYSGGVIGQENTDSQRQIFNRNVALAQYVVLLEFPICEERETLNAEITRPVSADFVSDQTAPGTATAVAPTILDANVGRLRAQEFEKADAPLASNKKESTGRRDQASGESN